MFFCHLFVVGRGSENLDVIVSGFLRVFFRDAFALPGELFGIIAAFYQEETFLHMMHVGNPNQVAEHWRIPLEEMIAHSKILVRPVPNWVHWHQFGGPNLGRRAHRNLRLQLVTDFDRTTHWNGTDLDNIRTVNLTLLGEPGSGKTTLLGRLQADG